MPFSHINELVKNKKTFENPPKYATDVPHLFIYFTSIFGAKVKATSAVHHVFFSFVKLEIAAMHHGMQ